MKVDAENDALFRSIFERTAEPMLVVDDAERCVEANDAACALLGRSRHELLESRISGEIATSASEDASSRRLLSKTWWPRGELKLPAADGTIRTLSLEAMENVAKGRHLVVVRDVTEQNRLHAHLAIADRMVSMGTLAAGVAHEINNPLAAVIGNVEFAVSAASDLRRSIGATEELEELSLALQDTFEAANRVRQTVRDLKLFSRDEEEIGPVDVRRIMESTLRMVWNEIRHRARLIKDYGRIPTVDANGSRLGQVFINLLVNAAQAIPEGNADQNEIRIVTSHDDGWVNIDISDTGCGISEALQDRIFEPFYTTKPIGVGTGLGLSISHGIVAGFGGELTVRSSSANGSTFRVRIPVGSMDAAGRGELDAPIRIAGPTARILVIDDDPLVLRSATRNLSPPHEVVCLSSPVEALERLRAGDRYEVVICDLMMPQMSGMELFEQLTPIIPDVDKRVVFLTGGAFTPRAREFLERSACHQLEKPFERESLLTIVRDIVRAGA